MQDSTCMHYTNTSVAAFYKWKIMDVIEIKVLSVLVLVIAELTVILFIAAEDGSCGRC